MVWHRSGVAFRLECDNGAGNLAVRSYPSFLENEPPKWAKSGIRSSRTARALGRPDESSARFSGYIAAATRLKLHSYPRRALGERPRCEVPVGDDYVPADVQAAPSRQAARPRRSDGVAGHEPRHEEGEPDHEGNDQRKTHVEDGHELPQRPLRLGPGWRRQAPGTEREQRSPHRPRRQRGLEHLAGRLPQGGDDGYSLDRGCLHMRHVQLEQASASAHDDKLAFQDDRLDPLGSEQPAPAVDRADGESGRLARRSEPRLLDPAEQPLRRLDARAVAAKEALWDDACHLLSPLCRDGTATTA